MKTVHTTLIVALVIGVFCLQNSVTTQEEQGWYTGGSLGLSNYKIKGLDGELDFSNEAVDFEETVFSYRAFVGHRVNQDVAFELALSDYGEATGPLSEGRSDSGIDFEIRERAAAAYVTGFLPLGNHYLPELEHVEVFGKAGPTWVDQEVRVDATDGSGNSLQTEKTENGVGVGVGIGLNFYVTKQLAIRGELESIFGNPTDLDDNMGTERIHGFIGLQYNFHDLPDDSS